MDLGNDAHSKRLLTYVHTNYNRELPCMVQGPHCRSGVCRISRRQMTRGYECSDDRGPCQIK